MQVSFSGGTPLLGFAPCRDCEPDKGWHSFADYEGVRTDGDSDRTNGTDLGFVTTAINSSVGLNFTGTGIKYNLMFAPVQSPGGSSGSGPGAGAGTGGTSSGWTTKVLVNGTVPPTTAIVSPVSIDGLPVGRHAFSLELSRTDGKTGNETWAHLSSVQGTTGSIVNAHTVNTTIDDTAWRNGTVKLSDGWNMLETNSNWINDTQYQAELANRERFYNQSISWTTNEGANTTITFTGSAVWAFGHTGGESGSYEVRLDNESQGTFNAAGGPRTYNQTLFFTSGLSDAEHTILLINRGGRLSYDAVVASTGLDGAPMLSDGLPQPTLGTTTGNSRAAPTDKVIAHDPAAKESGHHGPNTAVVAGASVGAVVGVLLLTFLAFLIWSRCRRRNKKPAHAWQEPQPWYKRMTGQDKGWKFVTLVDDPSRQMAQRHSVWDRVSRSETHLSSSSFGSSAAPLSHPAPAHTRRSLLPIANNLWAKAKRAPSEKGMQMTDVSSRKAESPDPMALALGGAASPLTRLQRSCSTDRPPKAKVTRADAATTGGAGGTVWDRARDGQRQQQPQATDQNDGWNNMFAPSSYGSDSAHSALSGGTVMPNVTADGGHIRRPDDARLRADMNRAADLDDDHGDHGRPRTYYNNMSIPPPRH